MGDKGRNKLLALNLITVFRSTYNLITASKAGKSGCMHGSYSSV